MIAMQKKFARVAVLILFAALQGWIMLCTDGDTMAIEILSLASTVVCLILLTIRHPLYNNDAAGNTITTIPAPCAVLQVISSQENEMKTGLHQQ
jgi:hypothetical protein